MTGANLLHSGFDDFSLLQHRFRHGSSCKSRIAAAPVPDAEAAAKAGVLVRPDRRRPPAVTRAPRRSTVLMDKFTAPARRLVQELRVLAGTRAGACHRHRVLGSRSKDKTFEGITLRGQGISKANGATSEAE